RRGALRRRPHRTPPPGDTAQPRPTRHPLPAYAAAHRRADPAPGPGVAGPRTETGASLTTIHPGYLPTAALVAPTVDVDPRRWPAMARPRPAPTRSVVARTLLRRVAEKTGVHVQLPDGTTYGPAEGPVLT